MKIKTFLFLIAFALIAISSCRTTKQPVVSGNEPQTPQLCGFYTGNKGLYDKLQFTGWNEVSLMPEFIPPSRYFITGDTLVIIPDKSYLLYRVSPDRQTLYGLGGWVGKGVLHLVSSKKTEKGCLEFYAMNDRQQHWLDLEKRSFEFNMNPAGKDLRALNQELCERGHARSCINFAYYEALAKKTTTPDTNLLRKAGELGDYMGYFRLGEVMEQLGNTKRAIYYFDKSCQLGHAASCMTKSFLQPDEKH